MKRFHIALTTHNLSASIADYCQRLGCEPKVVIENQYALWQTEQLNFSLKEDPFALAGQLRHLGWEDDASADFSQEYDVNGILWERFSQKQQLDEILALWPEMARG